MGDATLSTTSSTKSRTNLIYDHYFRHKRCWLLCLKLASLASFSDAWRPTVYPHRRSLSSSSCIIYLFVFLFFFSTRIPTTLLFSFFAIFPFLHFSLRIRAQCRVKDTRARNASSTSPTAIFNRNVGSSKYISPKSPHQQWPKCQRVRNSPFLPTNV